MSDETTQVAGQGEGQGESQVDAQAARQQTGEPQAPAQGDPQRQEGSKQASNIEWRQYSHLAPDHDFNKVIKMAKDFQDLQRDGFGDLITMAREGGYTGHDLITALSKEPEDRTKAEQAVVEEATGEAKAKDEGQWLSRQEAEDRERKLRDQIKLEILGEVRNETSERDARKDEVKAIQDALDGFGLNSKKVKAKFGDTEEEVDFLRETAENALIRRCQRILAERLSPRDPQYDRKIKASYTPAIVARAASELAPLIKQYLAAPKEVAGDQPNLNDIPGVSLHGGAGGRAQKSPQDMSEKERKEEAIRRVSAKKAKTG